MASMAMTASSNSRLARKHLAKILFLHTYIENRLSLCFPLMRKPKNFESAVRGDGSLKELGVLGASIW